MTDHDRLSRLFLEACDLRPDERGRFVDAECADDSSLRAELEAMLAQDGADARTDAIEARVHRAAALVSRVPSATIEAGIAEPALPSTIGPYRILERIGEGGMGVVYRAEQAAPVRRTVALKLIRAGIDGTGALARFEAERQALAQMDHPNVSHLFDAGATDDGRPWFAMELVHGMPITQYCRQQGLPARDRVALFLDVCRGVRHAHRRGVIHRDLKPSNILVAVKEGRPTPIVIDFSIAKALAEPSLRTEFQTRTGQIIGTLEYMAPEQATGRIEDIDTRSDVYALGVVLYELLADRLPHDVSGQPLHEAVRRVAQEPPRTLKGAATIITGRQSSEVETIVRKCLEKEADRRYGSAAELAEDIERYLDSRPILARPPSGLYQFRKLVGRHRAAFAGAALTILLLIVSVITVTYQLQVQRRERLRAENEANKAQAINSFFLDAIGQASPWEMGGDATIREVLDAAASRAESEPAEDRLVRAALHQTLKQTYVQIGDLEEATKHANRALALLLEVHGPNHPDVTRARMVLAGHLKTLGRYDEAETEAMEAIRIVRARDRGDTLDLSLALRGAAVIAFERGKLREALQLAEESSAMMARLPNAESRSSIIGLRQFGDFLTAVGRRQEGEVMLREAVDWLRSRDGEERDGHPLALHDLAKNLVAQGRHKEAIAVNEEALRLRLALYGVDHWWVGRSRNNLAEGLVEMGRCDEAEAHAREALRIWTRAAATAWSDSVTAWLNIGQSLQCRGDYPAAEEAYETGWRIAQEHPGSLPPAVSALSGSLGILKARLGHPEQGEALIRGWLSAMERWDGVAPIDRWQPLVELGSLLLEADRPQEAERFLRDGLKAMEEAMPESPGSVMIAAYSAIARSALGRSLAAQGRAAEACDLIASARQALANEPAALDSRRHESRRAGEHPCPGP